MQWNPGDFIHHGHFVQPLQGLFALLRIDNSGRRLEQFIQFGIAEIVGLIDGAVDGKGEAPCRVW